MQGDLHGGEKATFVPVEQRRIAAFTHKTQRFTWFTLLFKVWHPFCSTEESLSRKQLLLMDCNIERFKRCRSEGFGCCLDLQWVPWIPPQCGNVDRRPVPEATQMIQLHQPDFQSSTSDRHRHNNWLAPLQQSATCETATACWWQFPVSLRTRVFPRKCCTALAWSHLPVMTKIITNSSKRFFGPRKCRQLCIVLNRRQRLRWSRSL